jgi:hypothetical protein
MSIKFTNYFIYTRQRQDRLDISIDWILHAIQCPVKTEVQSDGRFRKWGYISAVDKYLRVVLLEDGITVHNAFFDRSFRGVSQ